MAGPECRPAEGPEVRPAGSADRRLNLDRSSGRRDRPAGPEFRAGRGPEAPARQCIVQPQGGDAATEAPERGDVAAEP